MIVVPALILKDLMTQIVGMTHELVDTSGNRVMLSTISEGQLRMAAITALQIATGEPVWPGDKKITVVQRPRTDEVFEVVAG